MWSWRKKSSLKCDKTVRRVVFKSEKNTQHWQTDKKNSNLIHKALENLKFSKRVFYFKILQQSWNHNDKTESLNFWYILKLLDIP